MHQQVKFFKITNLYISTNTDVIFTWDMKVDTNKEKTFTQF